MGGGATRTYRPEDLKERSGNNRRNLQGTPIVGGVIIFDEEKMVRLIGVAASFMDFEL